MSPQAPRRNAATLVSLECADDFVVVGGADPVAAYGGAPHKALIRLGGETLLARVVGALRAAGALADRVWDAKSAPCQASLRLGLPADFLYRRPAEQRRLLERLALAEAREPSDAVNPDPAPRLQ